MPIYLVSECFKEQANHKYRMTIAKGKDSSEPEKILVVYTGSASSRLLLHLSQLARQHNPGRPNLDTFVFVEIVENGQLKDFAGAVDDLELDSNDDFQKIQLAEALYPEMLPEGAEKLLTGLLASCQSKTTRVDLLQILKRLAALNKANQEGISTIFLEDSCSQLAVEIVAATCTGRGETLPWLLNLPHQLYQLPNGQKMRIVRPLRELVDLEVEHYLELVSPKFRPSAHPSDTDSILGLTDKFVKGLDEENSATVSTVLRTAQKLCSNCLDLQSPCVLCLAPRILSQSPATAVGTANAFCHACHELVEDMDKGFSLHSLPTITRNFLQSWMQLHR